MVALSIVASFACEDDEAKPLIVEGASPLARRLMYCGEMVSVNSI
jgi:hypothetical protein